MRKNDCVIIGDSLAAIHIANELAQDDFTVLLVRPDIAPVEVYESPKGAFVTDIASGCDLSFYSAGEYSGNLYGFKDKFELLPYPYRFHFNGKTLNEPGPDTEFLRVLSKQFPNHTDSLMRFYTALDFFDGIIDEIETKTGFIPPYSPKEMLVVFSQVYPWTSQIIKKASSISFARFLSDFNLPDEMDQLYTLMINDHLNLGLDSIDSLTGAGIITRRHHGLTYLQDGLPAFKDAMLDQLRSCENAEIIGGKKIDYIKTSAGIVYKIFIDQRDAHSVDWIIVDESIGLLGMDGSPASDAKFHPLGYYSNSHLDFKLCLGWEDKPHHDLPVGVNFILKDPKFPPHAPHSIRVDIMPPDLDDAFGLKTRVTVRGKYPVERILSSWGEKVDRDEMRKELLGLIEGELLLPSSKPVFAELILPKNVNDPFKETTDKNSSVTPFKFANEHINARVIQPTGINGGSIRLAFRCAERIAGEIKRKLTRRRILHEIAVKPIIKYPGFDKVVGVEPKR
ncbi:hypothetical protein KKB99_02705 [bacterium]|nr:hypothetical protein [bacterium]MBU1024898.1 hypothetical protein [bacterium]